MAASPAVPVQFDAKRLRKAFLRRTVDYNSDVVLWLEKRKYYRPNLRHDPYREIRPDPNFAIDLLPPNAYQNNPVNAVTTKFVHTSMNKFKSYVNVVRWTPEGRRLITGASSGEFTLWNGLTFNFETILQAHDTAIRSMRWSHNDTWMLSGDNSGIVKYWQSNMNNLKIIQAHKEAIREITFAPTDTKFATCSDDRTIKIWNFNEGAEESTLTGHGWDVKCLDWHPYKGLLASGSKDNLIKLWDPRTGKQITTLHSHKNTVHNISWNQNGNWLLSCSRDQLIKLLDIRTMKELQSFKGHKKECNSIAWHPQHESMFVSGGSDGSLMYWLVGTSESIAGIEQAHSANIWALDWHPFGHILATGSNDYACRFWTRNRPGDSKISETGEFKFDEIDLEDGEEMAIPGFAGGDDRFRSKVDYSELRLSDVLKKDDFTFNGGWKDRKDKDRGEGRKKGDRGRDRDWEDRRKGKNNRRDRNRGNDRFDRDTRDKDREMDYENRADQDYRDRERRSTPAGSLAYSAKLSNSSTAASSNLPHSQPLAANPPMLPTFDFSFPMPLSQPQLQPPPPKPIEGLTDQQIAQLQQIQALLPPGVTLSNLNPSDPTQAAILQAVALVVAQTGAVAVGGVGNSSGATGGISGENLMDPRLRR